MSDYNRVVRPVMNNSDKVTVKLGLKLTQIIDLNLKNQIMTINVWVDQSWYDYKLKWDPDEYKGVDRLHIPADQIWLPDVTLYNNADGNYEITIMTKAIVRSDGLVTWKPPAIYKSACEIDVEFFPFDQQTCILKFGTWSYDGLQIDLKHKNQDGDSPDIPLGIDLSQFQLSVEWDVMNVPAKRREKFYTCCPNPYLDITFNITIRRKTLFYTVNLILPCVTISAMSMVVFYLPSDSGEKVSLSISLLVSLGVFFLVLADIIPPTSLTVPLLGRYILFTMVLVTLSIAATIAVLNVNFRSPCTHRMAPWVRKVFLQFLPKLFNMQRPAQEDKMTFSVSNTQGSEISKSLSPLIIDCGEKPITISSKIGHRRLSSGSISGEEFPPPPPPEALEAMSALEAHVAGSSDVSYAGENEASLIPCKVMMNGSPQYAFDQTVVDASIAEPIVSNKKWCEEFDRALLSIRFVAQHMENLDSFYEVEEDWKFVAMVLDRLFLWIFAIACVVGTAGIMMQAPSLYDDKEPIDILYSKIVPSRRLQ
ncbi:Acetylcholine receptor subunit alpha-like 1 [Leptotrombidium deliense]|uniref:Acetylcholine receptor subunit alpha-like 1 n=1 Tax=Leptotrombidium deliense TaxID=299467 RepID=A0A443SB85_9ACAR|nr:Acetylcholine receptor subunit alpha-like 1 [Leptotrombidium deliense]